MIRLFLLTLSLLIIILPNYGEAQTLEEFVDELVTSEYLPASQSVGFGISVWSGQDGNLYRKGFGFRDMEANESTTDQSIFCIGSITKSFTSSIIVKVLSEKFPELGELALEMPIKDLIPLVVNVTLSDRYRSESASFRDLTSHRSCLNSHLNGLIFGQIKDFDEYIYRTRYASEVCPFRASYVYNNAMYALAGDLIGKIAGDSYENLMRQFLDDLGMTNSQLINVDEDYGTLANMMQTYYVNGDGSLVKANPNILRQVALASPAGAILSTAEDMQKYAHFHLSPGQSVGGQQVVSTEAMTWLSKPAILVGITGVSYGMGFNIESVPGTEPSLSHGGFWPNYSSFLSIVPSQNLGIFTSSAGPGENSGEQIKLQSKIYQFLMAQSQNRDVGDLTHEVIPVSQGKNVGPIQILDRSMVSIQNQNGKAVCTQEDVVGSFGSGILGEIEIYMDDGTGDLKILYGFWGDGILHQVETEECKFDIEWTTDIVLMFYGGLDGVIAGSSLQLQRSEVTGTWDVGPFVAGGEGATVQRNLNIGNLPQIPYDPDSCVAENFYG